MTKNLKIFAMISILTISLNSFGEAEDIQVSESKPQNLIGVEGLGRGLIYSVFYERRLSERFSAGVGLTSYSGSFAGPIYINFSDNPEFNNTYFTAGFLVSDPDRIFDSKEKGIYKYGLPMAGIGWENKFSEDLNYRLTVYGFGLFGPISIILPWV